MRPILLVCALLCLQPLLAGAAVPAARTAGPAPVDRSLLPAEVPASSARLFADRPWGRRAIGEKAPASLRAILVMCDFSDSLMFGRWGNVPGNFPPPRQGEILYAAHDSVFYDHLMRDVGEYFATVSGGAFSLDVTIHPRTVNLPHPMGFYGDHPEQGEQPVLLASDVLDSVAAEIDLAAYDTVLLVHAGAGEETDVLGNSPEQINSTYLDPDDLAEAIEEEILPPGGLPGGVEHVLVLPECEFQDPVPPSGNGMYGSLGVYCYEVGLRLGMLPLVDFTPAGRPDSQGIGTIGLMGYGLYVYAGWSPPHPCAYNKQLMGWQQPAVVRPGASFGLTPAERTGEPAAAARVDIAAQEYWLLEYRLQDPDGDRFWSFGGDLNGNFRRDFWDASEADGVPPPGAKFDPATDTREWLTGAEWDHFMTENGAAQAGYGGGGSGVYVWHVDESVIAAAMAAGGNTYNADPDHKSVDLEEADGIQDLDSASPSQWYLGSDFDPFRGGGADEFGPGTRPRTDTAAGLPTGMRFLAFSPVVLDSFVFPLGFDEVIRDTIWAREYADTVSFRLERAAVDGPQLRAERTLPAGVDLRGSHLLIVDLEAVGSPAAPREIVVADHQGGVWVLDGELGEYLDHDGDPATVEPFAAGRRGGEPVRWLLPAAVGDLDHDQRPDIVLTTADGLYAFARDGSALRDPEAGAVGLYRDLGACLQPPVLVPLAAGSNGDPSTAVAAAVLVRQAGSLQLNLFAGSDAQPWVSRDLGDVLPAAPPVLAFGRLWVAVSDTGAGVHTLLACSPDQVLLPEVPTVLSYPLSVTPGPFAVTWGIEPAGGGMSWVAVAGDGGGGQTFYFDEDLLAVGPGLDWSARTLTLAPPAPGNATTGDGVFGRLTQGGDWLTGWPVRPQPAVQPMAPDQAPGALIVRLAGSGSQFEEYLFTADDGRLFAFGTGGEPVAGWPAAGAGTAAATPAVGHVAGDLDLDLVVAGAFPRITGLDADDLEPTTTVVSSLAVYGDVATGAEWPMAGGSPWRNGDWNAEAWRSPPGAAAGSGIVDGSHLCFPSPLTGPVLSVQASVRAPGRARALIYNLEGEQVTASAWRTVPAREPFILEIDLGGAASGLYLCRLMVEDQAGASDQSVVSFAVAR